MRPKHKLLAAFALSALFAACDKSEPEPASLPLPCTTYESQIKLIADTKCALPDCHNSGSAVGDYTTYSGLKERADNGRLEQMVFELKIMPPANAKPLTDQEKDLLKCWIDAGAPEK